MGKRCILAGDQCQLAPVILSRKALEGGRGISLLERAATMHEGILITRLTTQYRMNDAIASWASKEIYGGLLKSSETVFSHLLVDYPFVKTLAFVLYGVTYSFDTLLVVSFISETRILAMNLEDELEEIEIEGFCSQVQTLFCRDAVHNQLVQVTSSSVRLVSSTIKELLNEWHAPSGYSVNVATANATQRVQKAIDTKACNALLKILDTSLEVRKVVVEICNILATHGARLSAAGILGILKKLGKDTKSEVEGQKNVIAMDGGLYEHYTEYSKCLENTLKELVGEDSSESIIIEHFNVGSGIGAAPSCSLSLPLP